MFDKHLRKAMTGIRVKTAAVQRLNGRKTEIAAAQGIDSDAVVIRS
ncbi:hypothetical protein [Celeribacter sp.]